MDRKIDRDIKDVRRMTLGVAKFAQSREKVCFMCINVS